MKIDIDKFLNILFAILKNDDIYSISVFDVAEVINIIYSSEDFELLMAQLDVENFNEQTIQNNKYIEELSNNGVITYKMDKKQQKKILDDNKIVAVYIKQAINKRAMVKYIKEKSNGLVNFKYDSPNGNYNLPYVNQLDDKCVSILFTDGKYSKNMLVNGEESDTYTRNIKIENATYSMLLTFINNIIESFEVRALFQADYNFVYNECMKLLKGYTDSYEEIIKEEPKVYKFKIH